MAKSNNSSGRATSANIPATPIRKPGRKPIGKELQYSPRERIIRVNKVFIVGTQFGIILLRTEKPNSKDDAYTNDVIKMIEDETSGVASKLQIIKICSRRESQEMDKEWTKLSYRHQCTLHSGSFLLWKKKKTLKKIENNTLINSSNS